MFNQKEYLKKYYLRTREKQIERAKKWQKENYEKAKSYRFKRYWSNPDRFRNASKQYKIENRNLVNIKNRRSSCNFHLKRRMWWINERCNNKNHKGYNQYGGRGIKNFLTIEDLRIIWNRDKANKMNYPTIDRINNDGNYEFSNCRFIEKKLNEKKMRKERLLSNKERKLFLKKLNSLNFGATLLSKKTGINRHTFSKWFNSNIPITKLSYKKILEKGVFDVLN